MRQTTLETLGLGTVLEIFQHGRLPADAGELVDAVFGPAGSRGSLVISGANGIVGAGKAMQFGSRLQPYDVRIVGLDFPGAPDGIGQQYPGLVAAFGPAGAAGIMGNIVRLTYDGTSLPAELAHLRPAFLLEAIPEILDIKKAHYKIFRDSFPGLEIRSVTSGFPMRELGVGIAHPAFPHEINKVWEVVEPEPSDVTRLMWALGMIPMPVSDDWSFVLDVLFCGVTLAGLKYHHARNMPCWKVDKHVRRLLGPNPFRAHDAIGAAGANFLTWSCLHHLSEVYGPVFKPTPELEEHKETGADWYPPNHFRPLVDWKLDAAGEQDFEAWILGPMFQMTSLILHEKRAHLAHINAIGELCAQFRSGILAFIRSRGPEAVIGTVEAYHRLEPDAAGKAWHPGVFEAMDAPEWQQLYVNAEHDGTVGVVTISRESYNGDVDRELNRALDWLKAAGIERMILTGDFHLATQMVGADTSDFYPALEAEGEGRRVSGDWSRTARRLDDEFRTSVAFVNGKRCLGGMLELATHCHYLVAVEDAQLGMPEVTVPVVPGMEGCHWPFRKAASGDWPKLLRMLLSGRPVKAAEAVGWLADYAGPLDQALARAWQVATGGDHGLKRRPVETGALEWEPTDVGDLAEAESPAVEAARKAIIDAIQASHGASVDDALEVQSKHSAGFMLTQACHSGRVGAEYKKTMKI
ncbi:MAG: enoyl-CoA hydratase/isomerase family protein [Planctomycetota bacterium]|jgi:enoyl-CoA hydratase/carnithine racemase